MYTFEVYKYREKPSNIGLAVLLSKCIHLKYASIERSRPATRKDVRIADFTESECLCLNTDLREGKDKGYTRVYPGLTFIFKLYLYLLNLPKHSIKSSDCGRIVAQCSCAWGEAACCAPPPMHPMTAFTLRYFG
jgi:hypothetical protein